MKDSYDVVVVGAGPAGSMTVLGLARQCAGMNKTYSVLWVDKRRLSGREEPEGFEKSCGGLLDKRSQEALAAFGLAIPAGVMAEPQIFTLKGIDLDNKGAERYYQRQYVNINRFRFDRWLEEIALEESKKAGLQLDFCDETTAVAIKDNNITLRDKKNKLKRVEMGCVAGCGGATSWLRRYGEEQDDKLHPLDRYVSIQEWYECPEMPSAFTAVFDRDVTDYYSWMIPENGKLLIGSSLKANPEANQKFEKYKEDLKKLGLLPEKCIKRRGAVIYRPHAVGSCFTGAGNVFLAGEAAGLISPSTCEGISFALRSGKMLGKALAEHGSDTDKVRLAYKAGFDKLAGKIFWMSFKSPIMYGPFLRRLVFKSGALSMKLDD